MLREARFDARLREKIHEHLHVLGQRDDAAALAIEAEGDGARSRSSSLR
jgi:hypothetical protein